MMPLSTPRNSCWCPKLYMAAGLAFSFCTSFAATQPVRLQCQLFAGGEDHQLVFLPTVSPYTVKPTDLERFRFKAVVSQSLGHIEHIKITVSYRTAPQALILQQATYLPPFVFNQTLTGRQQLYSPNLGRELTYDCSLRGAP